MKDKISVIMACYNCAATLPKAIDSILAQSYDNWVMICCDDGSTDDTLAILNSYKEKYPDKFIVLKNLRNMKLPYSLNHCLEYVETELVARMDGDDWSMPERFAKQVEFLRNNPEYDLVGTAIEVNDGMKRIGAIVKTEIPNRETMLRQNAFNHATIMTYKRVYDTLGGYSLAPSVIRVEDVDLWFRFIQAGFKGYNLSEELYTILEDENAVKRRTLKSRVNAAKTKSRGRKLMGFRGPIVYFPYINILKAFVPVRMYQVLHKWKLNHSDRT